MPLLWGLAYKLLIGVRRNLHGDGCDLSFLFLFSEHCCLPGGVGVFVALATGVAQSGRGLVPKRGGCCSEWAGLSPGEGRVVWRPRRGQAR